MPQAPGSRKYAGGRKRDGGKPKVGHSASAASDKRGVHPEEAGFPIVAIGASAGGLEAIERFFRAMPPDSGMGFIFIQHLSPDHESIMAEIIQRFTAMAVRPVKDGMQVLPNHVYVIPSGQDMLIKEGVLRLEPQARTRGLRLPIDLFFRSLAEDQQERSICILLSGAGSDGTLGFKTVKALGGITMAQDGGAKFHDMPQSAIASGMVDFVLLAEDMPAKLLEIARERPILPRKPEPEVPHGDKDASLKKVFQLVRLKTGHDFSRYKPSTILRRIERRMVLHRINDLQGYAAFLEKDGSEAKALFSELLIGVTHFFRDPEAFESLAREVLPQILDNKAEGESLRIWVPGCSTGEEAYTLAMLIVEFLAVSNKALKVQIFCTDVDPEALEVARRGVYSENIAADISPERLGRFFYKEGKSYRVAKEIRDMLVVAQHSIIKDPPFTRLDLISCRNLLIYFGAEIQKKLIPLFHYSLNSAGFLFLGPSESLGEYARFFSTIDGKWKIFQRKDELPEKLTDLAIFPMERAAFAATGQTAAVPVAKDALPRQAERILQEEYAPPSILVNEQYEALHFYGKVGRYLELSGGEPTRNVLRLAKDDVRLDLRTVIHAAAKDKSVARRDGLRIHIDGETHRYDLIARPILRKDSSDSAVLVVFQEAHAPEAVCAEPANRPADGDMTLVKSLEEELSSTRERLQATIGALEASNEELKSSNEELMSMNEELQSSNEELETSREELQSLNEELNTVNQELQYKIEELNTANNDLNNLLSGTRIATLFVDNHLKIKRFTPQITEFFNLLDLDIGRPLADIAHTIDLAGLIDDIRRVIHTL
ncbi:MAG: chemotaxis protein CheB, partial [Desulfocurvibacter africanus]